MQNTYMYHVDACLSIFTSVYKHGKLLTKEKFPNFKDKKNNI